MEYPNKFTALRFLTEHVMFEGGYVTPKKPTKLTFNPDVEDGSIVAMAVVYKFEQSYYPEDSESTAYDCNLVVIDDKFHSWDIDDYFTHEEIEKLFMSVR